MVNLLRGELSAAHNCFEEISQMPSIDPGRLMRAAGYANLAVYYQYNRFPDGNGATAQEIEARWHGQAYAEAETQQWQLLTQRVSDPELQLEASLVHSFLCNFNGLFERLPVSKSSINPMSPAQHRPSIAILRVYLNSPFK